MKNQKVRTESPAWLYLFSLAALGLVGLGCVRLYWLIGNSPRHLTGEELAEPYIQGKHLFIADLIDSNNMIEGRTFEGCLIYGPAVIFGDDSTDIKASTFRGGGDAIFLEAEKGAAGQNTGVILLKDCKFRHCIFINITLAGTSTMIDRWKQKNTGSGTYHRDERAPETP